MGTLVCFHAHPDDESIATAGSMACAAAAGHRVVLVVATRGEQGEPVPGVLDEGEELAVRRTSEVYAAADVLGAKRVEFLGYIDSGMMGEPTNDVPWSFWQVDVEHAARRLAAILEEEQPDVVTIYDDNGLYGHPDHIQVHRVGRRAAELAGVPLVLQSTMNRDALRRRLTEAAASSEPSPSGGPDPDNLDNFGKPESEITHVADVTGELDAKRRAMQSHPSQMSPDHFLLALSPEAFAIGMGTESYIRDDVSTAHDAGPMSALFQPTR